MAKPIQHLRKTSTEASLKNSLLTLLQEKPLEKITIKEICEQAGIYRTTFYAHYSSISELLINMEEEIMGDFRNSIRTLYNKDRSVFDFSLHFLEFVSMNRVYFRVIFTTPHCEHFRKNLVNQLSQDIYHLSQPYSSTLKEQYYPTFLAGGIISCLCNWIREDCATPIYDMAELLVALTHQANLGR